ncbi:MAG: M56 family metallopeptidase [Oscillospiraceae bacterium]
MSVLFSVTVSVSLAAALFLLFKGRIAKRYGFGIIYILSLILAIRLIIPYSIQLPEAPALNLVIPSFVPVLWAVGAVLCILFQTGKYLYFRKTLLSESTPASDEKELSDRVRKELFIDNEIPVLRSEKIGSPMLLGFRKPVIFLPRQDYSETELLMIFRHELMHFKRKDPYKKLFFGAVAAVQWFNPFAWLIMRECSGSLEALCDREVTKNKDNSYKRDYCYLLLKTGKNTGGLSAATSYFSTKEMLKLRIDSVFDNGHKKRGGALVLASIVCLSLVSGLLCSCTVETPQNVIDEMNRIESGVSNEKEQGVIDGESAEITLRPVSEVTAAAKEEIAKIAAADGIFKIDECNIIIPQVDRIPIYEQSIYGLDTPQQVYEQLRYIEKEWLGDNYYPDEAFIAIPYGMPHREEWTIEEFLSMDKLAAIYNSRENYDGEFYGSIETMGISLRLWETPLLDSYLKSDFENDWFSKSMAVQKVNCFTADESALSQKLTLTNGEIALAEAIKAAEDYMNSFRYCVDEKISYKVEWAYIFEMHDGKNAIQFDLRCFVGDIPFEYVSVDVDKEIPFSCGEVVSSDHMEMIMIRTDGFDSIITTKTNTMFTEAEKTVTEIITVDNVFEILKHRLSNSVVWDIYEISLGYTSVIYDKNATWDTSPYYTHPVWYVTISTGTKKYYQATIDAVTGELYFWEDFRER